METRIKERLTGALILVALFVIFVPELLPGHSLRHDDAVPDARPATEGPPVITYKMPLDGTAEAEGGQGALEVLPAQQADRLPPPAPTESLAESKPAPVAAAPAPAPETKSVKPVTAEPVPEPSKPAAAEPKKPAAAEPKTPAAPEHKKPAAAEPKKSATAETKKPPAEKGKPWFVQLGVFTKRENADQLVRQVAAKGQSAHASGSPPTVRVRIGPLPDKAAAQALKKRLGVEGFSATIVAP